ncbi:MAG: HlyC/CorC family transporter [Theionarchaea archaeon]|nr:HlyC/CorC family transporter [Theionarchaea archaeon]MBU7036638.1 HlyC/CorC family transporter [Theionarchaea archaeon]
MFEISYLWLELMSLAVLLLLSAFFSSSETAFLSSRKIRIRHLAEEGNSKAETIRRMMEEPDKVVAAVVIGNNIVNVAASSVATSMAITVFGNQGVGAAIGIMTFLILVVGEITPKGFAVKNAEHLVLTFSRPLYIITKVLSPVATALNAISRGVSRLLGGELDKSVFLTEEEFKTFLTIAEEEGSLEEEERERIYNVFEFSDTVAREVMTPRTDMVCLDVETSLEDAKNLIVKSGFSRIPVYEDNVDHIVGILYAKDLLRTKGKTVLRDLLRDPYFIPETKKVDELLEKMQKSKVHLAIVVDEYGGTAGIVTIEDLLEEIVGEIFDEYDVTRIPIRVLDDHTVLINGMVPIDEVNELLNVNIPENGFETIGGFMLDQFGHIPEEGEKITYNGVDFAVFQTDKVRIMKVKAKRVPRHSGEEEV